MHRFEGLADIPDLVPQELLIPDSRDDLRVPALEVATATSTTPLEVGYVLFTEPGWLYPYKKRLEYHQVMGERSESFLNSGWINHVGRAVVRVALDPDRQIPIDMFEAYQHECAITAQYPSHNEEDYYKHWVENFGVFKR